MRWKWTRAVNKIRFALLFLASCIYISCRGCKTKLETMTTRRDKGDRGVKIFTVSSGAWKSWKTLENGAQEMGAQVEGRA